MINYNPYLASGFHILEVTLQFNQYKGHIKVDIGGNCCGNDILEVDFRVNGLEECENDCCLTYLEDDDEYSAVLKDRNGDILVIEESRETFNRMVVGINIISQLEE